MPYTWLSETRRNLLDELYFVFGMYVFGIDLKHATLSSCISYLFPAYTLGSHHIEIFTDTHIRHAFSHLWAFVHGLSSICMYSPFLSYLEDSYSFSQNVIRQHLVKPSQIPQTDNGSLLCVPMPFGEISVVALRIWCSKYLFVGLSPPYPGCEFFIYLCIFIVWQLINVDQLLEESELRL